MFRKLILPLVAAGLSLSHRAMAQNTADRPSATPIALRQLDRDTLIPQSMARDLGPLIAAPPQVIVTPRWRVTVAFAPTVPLFASTARFAEAISGCLSELPASTEPSAFAASNSPWAAFDSAASALPLVLISISPNGGPGASCGDAIVDLAAAAARGLEFLSPAYFPDHNPSSATVRLANVTLSPVYAGQVRVLRVRSGVANKDSTQQLRLYIPLDDVRPDSSGRFSPAQLRVVTTAGRPDTIAIPERVLRQVWAQAMPWRVDRLHLAGSEEQAVRNSIVELAASESRVRRDSRVRVGTTLWTGHDSSASSVVLGQALEADPCLASSPTAAPNVRAAVSRLRSGKVCRTRSPLGVMGHGILFPGLGQRTVGGHGKAVALSTTGILALSGLAAIKSRQAYESYQSSTTSETASKFFDSASSYRAMATGMAVSGVAVWIGSAVEAAWKQMRRNASIREVSSYGGTR